MSEISGISGITKIFLLLISCIISMTRSQLTGAEIFYSNGPEKMRLIVNNQIETSKYRIIAKFAF